MTVASNLQKAMATARGIHAALEGFGADCDDADQSQVYAATARGFAEIAEDLGERLRVLEEEEPQYRSDFPNLTR